MKKWINKHCVALTRTRQLEKIRTTIHIQDSMMKQSGLRIGDHVEVQLSDCGGAILLKRNGTRNNPGKGYCVKPEKKALSAKANKGRYIAGKVDMNLTAKELQGLQATTDTAFFCVDVLTAGHGKLVARLHSLFQPTEKEAVVC